MTEMCIIIGQLNLNTVISCLVETLNDIDLSSIHNLNFHQGGVVKKSHKLHAYNTYN